MIKKINGWLVALVEGPAQSEEEQAWRRLRREFSTASKRGVALEQYLAWSDQQAFFKRYGEWHLQHFFAATFMLLMPIFSVLGLVLLRGRLAIPFGWILDLTFLGLVIYFCQVALRHGFRCWQWRRLAKQLPAEASPASARA